MTSKEHKSKSMLKRHAVQLGEDSKEPMTFEQWLKTKEGDANYGLHRLSEYRTNMCKAVWEACEAEQAKVIAELVEALELVRTETRCLHSDEQTNTLIKRLVRIRAKIDTALAKVKGKQ